jgi:6-phosphogluconate dehydrogenase
MPLLLAMPHLRPACISGPNDVLPCLQAINAGVAVPGFSISLAYYDTYRRENVPANLVQVGLQASSVLLLLVHPCYMLKTHFEMSRRHQRWVLKAVLPVLQAQRDFFGSHTYERVDKKGAFHTVWDPRNSADSITSLAYNT